MKLKFPLYLVLLLSVSCGNSEIELKNEVQVSTTPVVQDNLEQKATILMELHDAKKCKEFINTFPNNFKEFNLLYGYDDKEGARLLYSKPEHITYFFDCSGVSALEKLKKSIEVGVDGKWDADLIAMFQDGSFKLTEIRRSKLRGIRRG